MTETGASTESDEQATGLPLPGLRSWRGVYIFVAVVFVMYVLLLTILGKAYSS